MGAMSSQITSLKIVYSTAYSGTDQRKHQSSASLAFVGGEFPAKRASNTLGPRQNGQHLADDTLNCVFNEIIWIAITITLKNVPICPINNSPALNQIMAWRRPGDKPLFKQMLVIEFTGTCVRHSASVDRFVFHVVRILVMHAWHKTEIATFAEMPPSWANHVLCNAICG